MFYENFIGTLLIKKLLLSRKNRNFPLRHTFTDTVLNHFFFVLAGLFILLQSVFSATFLVNTVSTEYTSDSIILSELLVNCASGTLYMEDESEPDFDKVFCGCLKENIDLEIHHFTDYFFPDRKVFETRLTNNYFHSDLSPPLFMKG